MWLKIKVWTKAILAGALALYALLFIYNNSGQTVRFWWWFRKTEETSVFILALGGFFVGAVVTVMLMTTFRTLRQVREMRERSRATRMERELADMQSKAAMLQTRLPKPSGAVPPQEMPE